MKKLILLCFISCLPLALYADGYKYFVHDNIQYAYLPDWKTDENGKKYRTVRVAHFKKDGVYYKGDLVIPASFTKGGTEYRVDGIISQAFWGSSELTSITVLSPIFHIGHGVFGDHRKLEKIVFEDAPTGSADWNSEINCKVFLKNGTRYISRSSMKHLEGHVVREEIDTRRLGDYDQKYAYSVIDTLHIKSKGEIAIVHSNKSSAGRVNTLIIDEITEQRPFSFKRDTTVVYYLNVDNVVLGSGVTKLYDNMLIGDIKSITVQGTVMEVSPLAFRNISHLERYDVGDNQNVLAAIEYSKGAELERLGEVEKAVPHLRKASELGVGLATELLARHEKDAKVWKEKMTESFNQGNNRISPQLQAMEYCDKLRELYPSIAAQAKSLTCDTTQSENIQAMCYAIGIYFTYMDRQDSKTALRYKLPGYEDIRNKGLDMLVYFLVSKELTKKRRAKFYVEKEDNLQVYRWLGKERDDEIAAINFATEYSNNYSKQSAPEFQPFFAMAKEKLTAMRKEIWERSEKEHQKVIEHNDKYYAAVAALRSPFSSSSSIDPNTVSIPSYEDGYGNNGLWRSNGGPMERKEIRFSDGLKMTICRQYKSGLGMVYWPVVYGIDLLERGWKTEEDAAAAGYVCRKYNKIRSVGRYSSMIFND